MLELGLLVPKLKKKVKGKKVKSVENIINVKRSERLKAKHIVVPDKL